MMVRRLKTDKNRQKLTPKRRIYVGQQFDEKIVEANEHFCRSVNVTHIAWAKPTKNGRNFHRPGRRKRDAIVTAYAWAKLTQMYKIAYTFKIISLNNFKIKYLINLINLI